MDYFFEKTYDVIRKKVITAAKFKSEPELATDKVSVFFCYF